VAKLDLVSIMFEPAKIPGCSALAFESERVQRVQILLSFSLLDR